MIITTQQIKEASMCMRYFTYRLETNNIEKLQLTDIIEKVIKKSYIKALETTFKPEWKQIVYWVDKEIFADVNPDQIDEFKKAKRDVDNILQFLSSWYHKEFIPEVDVGYIDIPLSTKINNSIVQGVIPILKIKNETPTITIFREIENTPHKLYNNMEGEALAYIAHKELNISKIDIEYTAIGNLGGIKKHNRYIREKDFDRIETALIEICAMIEAKFTFPSFTEMCNICPFSKRCKV